MVPFVWLYSLSVERVKSTSVVWKCSYSVSFVCLSHHFKFGGTSAVGSLFVVFIVGLETFPLVVVGLAVVGGMVCPSRGCPPG